MYAKAALVIVAAMFFANQSAHAEVLDSSASGFSMSNRISVPTDPDATFAALVNDIDQWWPKDHSWWGQASTFSIEARAGGCFCERNGAQQALHMTVTHVDPGKLLRMTGGLGPLQGMGLHGVLEFRLSAAEEGGTTVEMYYRAGGYTPDDLSKFAAVVDQVQALQIGGLKRHLSPGGE